MMIRPLVLIFALLVASTGAAAAAERTGARSFAFGPPHQPLESADEGRARSYRTDLAGAIRGMERQRGPSRDRVRTKARLRTLKRERARMRRKLRSLAR
jgi:hypothetical protein